MELPNLIAGSQVRETVRHLKVLARGAHPFSVATVLLIAITDGLFQAFGVASIMPFIALLADPTVVDTHPFFLWLQPLLPTLFIDNLVWMAGLFALAALITSNALTVLNYWVSLRFFNHHSFRMSVNLLSLYLGRELLDFHRNKLSDMTTTILSEVERVVIDTLMAGVGLLVDLVVIIAISSLLLYINPWATAIIVCVLGGVYLLVHLATMREIERLGKQHAQAEAQMFATLNQALSLFKEAKITGKGRYFLDRFARPAHEVTQISNRHEILTFIPAQLIEVSTFALMLVVAMYFTGQTEGPFDSLAIIAFYAFAAYRLIPVLKSLLDGFESFRYGASVVHKVVGELEENVEPVDEQAETTERLPLRKALQLENLAFRYPGSNADAFSNLNATLPANQMTCLIGPSGAGKSTLLDLLMGLLHANAGQILIDGHALSASNRKLWQNSVGYVPQQVQLLDASLAHNIALGENQIDQSRIEQVARAAGLHRLATEQLAQGYQTPIGDGGHALSSGERQRVGIARALYRAPTVLLLDEATNELDAATETAVMQHLLNLPNTTLIFATHKQAIWEQANCLIELAGRFE